MAEYTIAWTFGGYTTVEADDEDQARTIFMDMNHNNILNEASCDGLDVVGIEEEPCPLSKAAGGPGCGHDNETKGTSNGN